MKRLNLFWIDDCIGSIYFPAKNDLIILDLDAAGQIFFIDIPIRFTDAERFKGSLKNQLSIYPISIFYGGNLTMDGFTLVKSGDDVEIVDKNSVTVCGFRFDDVCIEPDEEFCYIP